MPSDWGAIAAQLRLLRSLQEWDLYVAQLRGIESDLLNQLATADRDWRYLQGRLQGVRDAIDLPDRILRNIGEGPHG